VVPRLAHREQDGFSLVHLTLEAAQALQLSRSLVVAVAVDQRRNGVESAMFASDKKMRAGHT
jgi:hypothetical protein